MRSLVSRKLGSLLILTAIALGACSKKAPPPTEECRYVDGQRICEGGARLSAPSFDGVSPATAKAGMKVIVTGRNFDQLRKGGELEAAQLRFGRVDGDVAIAEWVVRSATELEAVVPADAEFGTISLLTSDADAADTVHVVTESEELFSPAAE